jgi:pimeloyl-ACP methyl ester carboxylesterase
MSVFRERIVNAGEMGLNVAVGPGNGPSLVMLHGVTRRWQDWQGILPSLMPFWEIHALDQRGHGKSERAQGKYHVIDYVRDAVAYVSSLSDSAVILGHSLGAMVAAGVAAALPDRVRAVVLEDPTFEMTGRRIGETGFPDLLRAYQAHAGSDRPVAEIARALAQSLVRVPGKTEPVPLGSVRDAASLRFSASCLKQLDPGVLSVVLAGRWLEGFDVADTLRNIRCPALLLQADFGAGGALPDEYAQELLKVIADCTRIKFPGAGHGIHSSQPTAMMNFVTPFLSAV